MTRGTVDAVVEALARPAIPNGGNFPAPVRRRPREPETRSRGVIVTQPACYGWRCDACRATGRGGPQLLDHCTLTGHRRYTPRGKR